MNTISIVGIIIGALILLLILFFVLCWVKVPPSEAFIISGLRKTPRVLIGTGGFRFPGLERIDKLYLGQLSVDIKTKGFVPNKESNGISVDANAKVQVDREMLDVAQKNFLNMTPQTIVHELVETLEGNMREVIGTQTLFNLITDRDAFSAEIKKKAGEDMAKLGIKVLSCNIQNLEDDKGLIEAMGADFAEKTKQQAAIIKANAQRDIKIAQENADKEANDVRVAAQTSIAVKNNELALKQASLKKEADTAKAEADAAYEIQKQEQQKTINTKTVEAQIEKTRQEQLLTEEKVRVRQNELEAEVNKQSDAAKYALEVESKAKKFKTETDAEAELAQRKRKAEAEAYEAEQVAKAVRAKAEAERYRIEQEAEAAKLRIMMEAEANKQKMLLEAEGVKAYGEAEAAAIEAKGLAEAEALRKKAEAYQSYNGSIKALEIVADKLPEVAKSIADPMAQIGNITIYGNGADAGQVSENVPVAIQRTFDTVSQATGVDLRDVLKKDTIQAQVEKKVSLETPVEIVHTGKK